MLFENANEWCSVGAVVAGVLNVDEDETTHGEIISNWGEGEVEVAWPVDSCCRF